MANVTFKLAADEADSVRGFLKLVEAQNKSEDAFKKGQGAGKRHGDMLKDVGKEIDGLVGKYIGLGAAIETARKAGEYYNKEREAGANRLKESEFSGSRLAQLAKTPAELKAMLGNAQKSSAQGGMDLPQAQNLQFALESGGIADAREMFAGLYGIIEQPMEMARAVIIARNAFGKKARDARQTLNEAKIASAPEPVTMDQLMLNVSGIAPTVAQLGGSQEEALSALAMLSGARKDPEQAATEIRAFATQAMRKGLGGNGLFGALDAAQKRTHGMSDKRLVKFFEDQEAMRGFETLSPRLDELRQRAAEIEGGLQTGTGDEVDKMGGLRDALPELNAPRSSRIAEQTLAAARQAKYGAEETEAGTAVQAIELESLQRGESPLRRFLRSSAAQVAKGLGASPENVIRAGVTMTGGTDESGKTPGWDGNPGDQSRANDAMIAAIMKQITAIEKNTQVTEELNKKMGNNNWQDSDGRGVRGRNQHIE